MNPPRGRGRPAIGNRYEVRLTPELEQAIETLATECGLTTASTLRLALSVGLAALQNGENV